MRYLLILLLCSCQPVIQKEFVTTELTRPNRPILPKVKATDLNCLSQDAYQRMYDRQRLVIEYAVTLEAIIDSTKIK